MECRRPLTALGFLLTLSACVSVCVCVHACGCVSERERAIKRCVLVSVRARVCVRSQPAAESRQRRGTGRVGGEVMSGTRQRPTDEREGGEDEEEARQGGRGGERSFLYCAAESRHRFSFLSDKVRLKVFIFSKKKKRAREGDGSVQCSMRAHLEAGIAVSNPHHPIQGRNKKCVTGIAFFFMS